MKKIMAVIVLTLAVITSAAFCQAAEPSMISGGITPQVLQKANEFISSLFPQLEPIGNGKWYFNKYGFTKEYRIKNSAFKNPPLIQLTILFELSWDGSFLLREAKFWRKPVSEKSAGQNSGLASGKWTDWVK